MSIAAMAQCWGPDFPSEAEGLSPQMIRVVALAVGDVVNDLNDNEFWGARRLLAEKVGCDPATVSDVMHHLCSVGFIVELERKRGKPVRYRWVGVVDQGSSTPTSRGDVTPGVGVTSPPNTKEPQLELKPASQPPTISKADRTALAKSIVNDYWERVKEETSKPPLIPYMGTVNVVATAVKDWPPEQISAALWTMRKQRKPITMQVLGEHLDGRFREADRRNGPGMVAVRQGMERARAERASSVPVRNAIDMIQRAATQRKELNP
jgi:hypothetical protein